LFLLSVLCHYTRFLENAQEGEKEKRRHGRGILRRRKIEYTKKERMYLYWEK